MGSYKVYFRPSHKANVITHYLESQWAQSGISSKSQRTYPNRGRLAFQVYSFRLLEFGRSKQRVLGSLGRAESRRSSLLDSESTPGKACPSLWPLSLPAKPSNPTRSHCTPKQPIIEANYQHPPHYPSKYHVIETIRPLIEEHWGSR